MFMERTGDTFLYYLADRLHMTVANVRAMTNAELEGWRAYHIARRAWEEAAG